MIKPITSYIKSLLGTNWVIGTNLFAGFVPAGVEVDCLIVIESGGVPDYDLPDALFKAVQIISRAKDYHTAMANAMTVFIALHGSAGITLPVITVGEELYANTITAISSPQNLGQDEHGLFNISTNYVFKLKDA